MKACNHGEKVVFWFGFRRDDKHFWCRACGAFRDCSHHGKWLKPSK